MVYYMIIKPNGEVHLSECHYKEWSDDKIKELMNQGTTMLEKYAATKRPTAYVDEDGVGLGHEPNEFGLGLFHKWYNLQSQPLGVMILKFPASFKNQESALVEARKCCEDMMCLYDLVDDTDGGDSRRHAEWQFDKWAKAKFTSPFGYLESKRAAEDVARDKADKEAWEAEERKEEEEKKKKKAEEKKEDADEEKVQEPAVADEKEETPAAVEEETAQEESAEAMDATETQAVQEEENSEDKVVTSVGPKSDVTTAVVPEHESSAELVDVVSGEGDEDAPMLVNAVSEEATEEPNGDQAEEVSGSPTTTTKDPTDGDEETKEEVAKEEDAEETKEDEETQIDTPSKKRKLSETAEGPAEILSLAY